MTEKIALGLGDNIDYEIIWDSNVFEDLILQYDVRDDELSADQDICDERDLVISILSFLKGGNGGERFVSTTGIIEKFAEKFIKKVTLGGTPVRAAIAMRKLGYTSALHLVTVNDDVRRLIPQDSPYVCSNTIDSSFPHLIVQFGKGCRVKAGDIDICTPRENRIIYHHDVDNIVMALNEGFVDLLTEAEVFLVSGFNAMQDETLLLDRLEILCSILNKLPEKTKIFYEDACFSRPAFSRIIHERVAASLDIYSLNEDELQHYLGKTLDLLDAVQIVDALRELQTMIPAPLFVVHSMYWALAFGKNAEKVAQALKSGVTMATTRYHYGDDFTVADYQKIAQLPPNPAGTAFSEQMKKLLGDDIACVSVVHGDVKNPTTVGLGDAFVGGFLPALLLHQESIA